MVLRDLPRVPLYSVVVNIMKVYRHDRDSNADRCGENQTCTYVGDGFNRRCVICCFFFKKVTPPNYEDCSVSVKVGYKRPHKDVSDLVNVRLDQKLKHINLQGANFVRFSVVELDFRESEVAEKNASSAY